jgi:hypothetical protein
MVPVRNEMLSSLPASEREALGVHLTRTLLPRDLVLHETGATAGGRFDHRRGYRERVGGIGRRRRRLRCPERLARPEQSRRSDRILRAGRPGGATSPAVHPELVACAAARSAQSIPARAGAAIRGLPCIAPPRSAAQPLAASGERSLRQELCPHAGSPRRVPGRQAHQRVLDSPIAAGCRHHPLSQRCYRDPRPRPSEKVVLRMRGSASGATRSLAAGGRLATGLVRPRKLIRV